MNFHIPRGGYTIDPGGASPVVSKDPGRGA